MDNTQTYDQICKLLDGIKYTTLIHEPTKTSEESAQVRGVSLASGAKAMLLVNKRTLEFTLCVMSAAKKLSWKQVRKILNSKHIDMATEQQVWDITKCLSGAVPPFGSIFGIPTYLDQSLIDQGDDINFNAGLRTHSIGMTIKDYITLEHPIITQYCE